MKLLNSTGLELTVRDIGPVLFRLRCGDGAPLPIRVNEIVPDDEAREECRRLVATGLYRRVEP